MSEGALVAPDRFAGIVPFVLLQLVGLVAVVVFPALVLWLPSVVYD